MFTKQDLFALAAAFAGGMIGHYAFKWIAEQGFYALVLPGGLIGIGAGCFNPRHIATPIACGTAALGVGLFSEWRLWPFEADDSFAYFLAHVADLKPFTLLMIAAGAAIGFWLPFRRVREGKQPQHR